MLPLPQRGILRSLSEHRSQMTVMSDWIEASVLIADQELSHTDVLDILIEQGIYDDQDFCSEFVASTWREIRHRLTLLGPGSPISFSSARMSRKIEWRNVTAHTFCLCVSLAACYSDWVETFGSDYTEQGEIFELLVKESMARVFPNWRFILTGWSRHHAAKLSEVVPMVAEAVGEDMGDLEEWGDDRAHESGLDLAWHLPFPDGRGGAPVYLAQCASGANWQAKVDHPRIAVWRKLVNFKYNPAKAFALPFALEEGEFNRRCVHVQGLLLDRYRLLLPSVSGHRWIPADLDARIQSWLEPRIEWLLSNRIG